MAWAGKSNPALVEAIVSTFRDPPDRSLQSLSKFTTRDWKRTDIWLNTGGLALYFLDRLRSTEISHAIDTWALRRLERNLADNKRRTADMLLEFVAINRAFQGAGMSYANLKGFTLSPDSCPDPLLRRPSDHDFLVDPAHMDIGRRLLEQRGYVLTQSSLHTMEFKSGSPQVVTLDRYYAAKPVQSVELHTAVDFMPSSAGSVVRDDRLGRLVTWTCDEGSFPVLGAADQLIGQAFHILCHLLSETSRPSWLLEYRNHVLARRSDELFWKEVRSRAAGNPKATTALGLATMLATDLFGPFSRPDFDSWTLDTLSLTVKLWLDNYGRRAVLADVPGTKLYLLLEDVLGWKPPARRRRALKSRLLPLQGPPRILLPPPQDTIPLRVRREITQLRYFAYRLRFHLKQGALYLVEAARWRRLMKELALAPHHLASTREAVPSPHCEKITRQRHSHDNRNRGEHYRKRIVEPTK
jgi:hypothetical protein